MTDSLVNAQNRWTTRFWSSVGWDPATKTINWEDGDNGGAIVGSSAP